MRNLDSSHQKPKCKNFQQILKKNAKKFALRGIEPAPLKCRSGVTAIWPQFFQPFNFFLILVRRVGSKSDTQPLRHECISSAPIWGGFVKVCSVAYPEGAGAAAPVRAEGQNKIEKRTRKKLFPMRHPVPVSLNSLLGMLTYAVDHENLVAGDFFWHFGDP